MFSAHELVVTHLNHSSKDARREGAELKVTCPIEPAELSVCMRHRASRTLPTFTVLDPAPFCISAVSCGTGGVISFACTSV